MPALLISQPSPPKIVSGNLRFTRYLFNKTTEANDGFFNRSAFPLYFSFFFFLSSSKYFLVKMGAHLPQRPFTLPLIHSQFVLAHFLRCLFLLI